MSCLGAINKTIWEMPTAPICKMSPTLFESPEVVPRKMKLWPAIVGRYSCYFSTTVLFGAHLLFFSLKLDKKKKKPYSWSQHRHFICSESGCSGPISLYLPLEILIFQSGLAQCMLWTPELSIKSTPEWGIGAGNCGWWGCGWSGDVSSHER